MRFTIYKILTYILLPVAAYIGLVTLLTLLVALSNFNLLFSVFLCGATVIYVFSSFAFLRKGLLKNLAFKQSIKDLIKVNGYVAIALAVLGLISGLVLLINPEVQEMVLESIKSMNKDAVKAADLSPQSLKRALYLMISFCLMLFVHVVLTFYYLRKNPQLFISSVPK